MFDRESVIWAAGVIEGEGYLAAVRQGNSRNLRVTVSMTDLDIIERLQKTFGLGRVKGPQLRGNWKPIFTLNICNFQDAQAVIAAIYPWLGVRRREQALIALMQCRTARPGFCRKRLHHDLADRRVDKYGKYYCRPCKSESVRLRAVL